MQRDPRFDQDHMLSLLGYLATGRWSPLPGCVCLRLGTLPWWAWYGVYLELGSVVWQQWLAVVSVCPESKSAHPHSSRVKLAFSRPSLCPTGPPSRPGGFPGWGSDIVELLSFMDPSQGCQFHPASHSHPLLFLPLYLEIFLAALVV